MEINAAARLQAYLFSELDSREDADAFFKLIFKPGERFNVMRFNVADFHPWGALTNVKGLTLFHRCMANLDDPANKSFVGPSGEKFLVASGRMYVNHRHISGLSLEGRMSMVIQEDLAETLVMAVSDLNFFRKGLERAYQETHAEQSDQD